MTAHTTAGRTRAARLPTWRLAAYGAPAASLAALALPLQLYVPTLYAQEMGIGLGAIAVVMALTRLWDMGTDPLVGWLSDRTRSRFGRRRTWMVIGLVPLMIASWALFLPPENAGAVYLFVSLAGVYTFGTMVIVPMNAWGAELTDEHHERTRITAFRVAGGLIGVLVMLIAPAAAGYGVDEVAQSTALVGVMALLFLPVAIGAAAAFVPDRPAPRERPPAFGFRDLLGILREPPTARLLAAFMLNMIATTGIPATLFLFYVKHVIAAPERAGVWLVMFFGATIVSLPLWPFLSKRIGKRTAWIAGMIAASVFFVITPFLGPGDEALFMAVIVSTGMCAGANLAIPPSMLADLVERDAARAGESRAGLYFAVWGSMTKIAGVIAAGGAFAILALAGFDAEGANEPGPTFVLAALYGFAPVVLNLAAAGVLLGYRLAPAKSRGDMVAAA